MYVIMRHTCSRTRVVFTFVTRLERILDIQDRCDFVSVNRIDLKEIQALFGETPRMAGRFCYNDGVNPHVARREV